MGRRGTAERIFIARRSATLNRLIEEHRNSAQRAEGPVVGWEEEAGRRGLERDSFAFWSDAQPWIAEQLNAI